MAGESNRPGRGGCRGHLAIVVATSEREGVERERVSWKGERMRGTGWGCQMVHPGWSFFIFEIFSKKSLKNFI